MEEIKSVLKIYCHLQNVTGLTISVEDSSKKGVVLNFNFGCSSGVNSDMNIITTPEELQRIGEALVTASKQDFKGKLYFDPVKVRSIEGCVEYSNNRV